MARPIPVFAFVFAAFAATSVGGRQIDRAEEYKEEPADDREARNLFMTTWRMLSRHSGGLRVRVGVVVGEGKAAPKLAACGDDAEELWLGEITETGRGFSGVPVKALDGSRQFPPGQKIGFELRHILGWSLDFNAPLNAGSERDSRANLELI